MTSMSNEWRNHKQCLIDKSQIAPEGSLDESKRKLAHEYDPDTPRCINCTRVTYVPVKGGERKSACGLALVYVNLGGLCSHWRGKGGVELDG